MSSKNYKVSPMDYKDNNFKVDYKLYRDNNFKYNLDSNNFNEFLNTKRDIITIENYHVLDSLTNYQLNHETTIGNFHDRYYNMIPGEGIHEFNTESVHEFIKANKNNSNNHHQLFKDAGLGTAGKIIGDSIYDYQKYGEFNIDSRKISEDLFSTIATTTIDSGIMYGVAYAASEEVLIPAKFGYAVMDAASILRHEIEFLKENDILTKDNLKIAYSNSILIAGANAFAPECKVLGKAAEIIGNTTLSATGAFYVKSLRDKYNYNIHENKNLYDKVIVFTGAKLTYPVFYVVGLGRDIVNGTVNVSKNLFFGIYDWIKSHFVEVKKPETINIKLDDMEIKLRETIEQMRRQQYFDRKFMNLETKEETKNDHVNLKDVDKIFDNIFCENKHSCPIPDHKSADSQNSCPIPDNDSQNSCPIPDHESPDYDSKNSCPIPDHESPDYDSKNSCPVPEQETPRVPHQNTPKVEEQEPELPEPDDESSDNFKKDSSSFKKSGDNFKVDNNDFKINNKLFKEGELRLFKLKNNYDHIGVAINYINNINTTLEGALILKNFKHYSNDEKVRIIAGYALSHFKSDTLSTKETEIIHAFGALLSKNKITERDFLMFMSHFPDTPVPLANFLSFAFAAIDGDSTAVQKSFIMCTLSILALANPIFKVVEVLITALNLIDQLLTTTKIINLKGIQARYTDKVRIRGFFKKYHKCSIDDEFFQIHAKGKAKHKSDARRIAEQEFEKQAFYKVYEVIGLPREILDPDRIKPITRLDNLKWNMYVISMYSKWLQVNDKYFSNSERENLRRRIFESEDDKKFRFELYRLGFDESWVSKHANENPIDFYNSVAEQLKGCGFYEGVKKFLGLFFNDVDNKYLGSSDEDIAADEDQKTNNI